MTFFWDMISGAKAGGPKWSPDSLPNRAGQLMPKSLRTSDAEQGFEVWPRACVVRSLE